MDIITEQYGEFKEDGKSYYHLDAFRIKTLNHLRKGKNFGLIPTINFSAGLMSKKM